MYLSVSSLCVVQDMSSLMHTIYDVVDASVNHSGHSKSKTLRVKLTVTPEPGPRRRETISSAAGETGGALTKPSPLL